MRAIRKLSPELTKKAKEELNESEEDLQTSIQHLREWLMSLPHIKEPLDDQWLAAFLRGNKFSLRRTKEKLENFYTVKTILPEFFKNRDPTVGPFRDLIHKGCFLPLENKVNPAGPSLVYFRPNYDPSTYSLNDFLKYSYILIDLIIDKEDNIIISGVISICDMKGASLKHLMPTPTFVKKCMTTYIKVYPIRTKAVHFLNPPTGFQTVLALMKMFSPAKIRNRLHVHQNIESLYEYVPRDNLPQEYGGSAGTLDELAKEWIAKTEKHKDFLVDSEKYCTDESLRPGGPKTADSEFSICSVM